ncbi:tetratricopeptide repeat protein [Chitinophaga sp.]|uniref:tetratricopeptide repeat protein n=1 Tax=Chitinophaga sp. TaxID=1869181 RepID=UPI0031D6DBB2
MNIFGFWNNSYYLIIILQIVCIIHCLKTGKRDYIYLLIFLPMIGCIIYFVREILPEINRGEFFPNLQRVFFPKAVIREWEHRVRISDTVANKMGLAVAYADQQQYAKAIELAEECRKSFPKDLGILQQLGRFYFFDQRYAESIACMEKAFAQTNANLVKQEDELMYARALEATGMLPPAEDVYKKVIRVHHSIDAMYHYGMFLKKQNRNKEALQQFQTIKDEFHLHPRYVRRMNAQWLRLAKREMAGL